MQMSAAFPWGPHRIRPTHETKQRVPISCACSFFVLILAYHADTKLGVLVATLAHQPALPGFCPLAEAVEGLASAGTEERGAVFTRREVVDFILDLVGYTSDQPLQTQRLLEPSFGGGDFLLPAVERLLTSYQRHTECDPVADLSPAIRAVELHRASFEETAFALEALLRSFGLGQTQASSLTSSAIHRTFVRR
jgi:hypothetical protein